MDREIPQSVLRRKRKRTAIKIISAAAVLAIAGVFLSSLNRSSIRPHEQDIVTVDRGDIELTVSATGKVIPLDEEIIVSPISTRILEVYKSPGDPVSEGEPLLRLELSSVETEYRQKLEQKQVMTSKLVQVDIRLENTISELNMERDILQMRVRQMENDLRGEKHLQSIGASTTDKVQQAQLAYDEARLKLDQLSLKIDNERRNADAELRVQELELSIFEKTLDESARLLNEARVMSPKTATLTFINNVIGSQVSQGAQLAVVSDLSRFKLECEIAEAHREKLAYGAKAEFKMANETLRGTVINITPSVANGLIKFTVVPDDSSQEKLRSGLSVDVNVVFDSRQDVMRVPYHKWYEYGRGDYYLWVIDGDRAEKRKVSAGNSGQDYVEITDGLREGDRIITADMEKFKNKNSLKIRQ